MPTNLVTQAASLLQAGDRESARQLLVAALRQRPDDVQAWLWLSGAVESDDERLECLQQALIIDPDNSVALAGLQSISSGGKTTKAAGQFPRTTEPSLEAFLNEQESILSIRPSRPNKAVSSQAIQPEPAPKRVVSTVVEPVMVAPADSALPGTLTLRGLLDEENRGKPRRGKNSASPLIPWRELPFSREQLLLSGLGLIIAFLVLLIGFSALKTLLHGPRVLAAPPAPPTPTALPTPVPSPTALAFQPSMVSSDCRFTMPANAQVECLTMILPESRDGSSARSVRLPLAIYRSLNPFPPLDPVIYLHGGPGASALEWAAENFEGFIGPLLFERDVIVFDGRGFGQATPSLDCPELLNQSLMELRQETDLEYRAADFGPAVKACRDRLASQGIRIAQFSTQAMAADVWDIVGLLGYKQVNLYGISFGASVAQVVLRDHPDILRRVVLDSAFPLSGKFYDEIAGGTQRALQALFESCLDDNLCRSQYPNLEAVVKELTGKLDQTPLQLAPDSLSSSASPKMVVDSPRFQEALRLALLTPGMIQDIPYGINNLRYNDLAFVQAVFAAPRMHYFDPALGGVLSVLCTEHAYASTLSDLDSSFEEFPLTAGVTRYELYGSGTGLYEICELWEAGAYDAQAKRLPAGATPVLILSGQLDPLASPDLLSELQAGLQQATWLIIPGAGHAVSIGDGGACPLAIAVDFLRNPQAEGQTGCLGEMRAEFRGR